MDIQVPKSFIENSCTVEETVLIINNNSDDPDSEKEDAPIETNPTLAEENFENDPEEEPNKEKDSEASKLADKPQCQQHRKYSASAFVSTRDAPSIKCEIKQDSSESDSSDSDSEILYDSEDEDEDSDELGRKMKEIDLACEFVDELNEEVNLPRHQSVESLSLEEIEEQIIQIELACSRNEVCKREEDTEPDLIRVQKFLTQHRQDMPPVPRVSADVQNLISTETESHDEDPDLSDLNDRRHVPFHSFEPESGRVNPIPRHYYSEDSRQQKVLKGNVKQDIRSRKDLHRPKPVSAKDHMMTHLRNIYTHIDPLTTEGIQRPTNQIDEPENSSNRLDEANRTEQQDNQTGNKTDPSPEE